MLPFIAAGVGILGLLKVVSIIQDNKEYNTRRRNEDRFFK